MERTNPYLNNIAFYLLLVFAFIIMISNALAATLITIILFIWITQTVAYRRLEWLDYPLFWPIAALIAYKTIVLLVSGYVGKFGASFEQIALPLIYFIVPTVVVTIERRRKVVWIFITGAVLVSGIGIIRYLMDISVRASSIISGVNTFAFFLTITLGLILSYFVHKKKYIEKLFYGLVSIPIFACIVLTMTRSVYGVVAVYMLFLGIFKDRKLLVPILILIPTFYFFMPGAIEKIQNRLDFSNTKHFFSYRDVLFEHSMAKIDEVGFFGYGINSFPEVIDIKSEPRLPQSMPSWHNMYFEFLFDGGPFSLLILLWILIVQTRYSIERYRITKNNEQKIFQLGVLLLLICMVLVGFLDNPINDQIVSMYFWTLLGMSVL